MTLEDQWLMQKEKTLAWLRLGFSVAAILVIQLNPARVERFPILSNISLYGFLVYSLLVLGFAKKENPPVRKIGIATTCLDLFWVSLMMLSIGGSLPTPFFVYYLFPVITASSRYGIKGGLLAALMGDILYGFIRFSPISETPLSIDTFIIRSIYLLVLAYIFGFLSEFEKTQNQKLMALYRTAAEAATQEERRRIARELHDRLLQVLASLTLRMETCRKHLIESPTELARELQMMEETTRLSMEEIRRFLAGKHTQPLEPGTLPERLREEMRFLRDRLGLKVILESAPEDLNLSPEVEQEVYYVLREGLMNVARHSHASHARVLLKQEGSEIQGSIEDDGVGFDLSQVKNNHGFGLVAMGERAKKLGGSLSIDTSPGNGTRISFAAPLIGASIASYGAAGTENVGGTSQ